jgi:hypothetical protein|tara:strand:- start:905 stop:1411 length:507 start_codon:yes stop_codon:yes gene_type:complete
MPLKNRNFFILLILLFTVSCGYLSAPQNETDLYKEKLEADGRTGSTTPITDLLPQLFGNSVANIKILITYEVALSKFQVMPLITASKSDGIITTDWYSTGSNPNERFKFNVIIKDDEMTNDSIIINMFKEKLDGGVWKTAKSNSNIADKIKETILKQSMQLKTAAELS